MNVNLSDLTSVIYGLLVLIWGSILALYVFNFVKTRKQNKTISLLVSILAIDAFRTLFESIYFGLYFSHTYEFITNSAIYQPKYLIIPKLVNLTAAIVIVFLLIKHWIPKFLADDSNIKLDLLESEKRRKFALDAAGVGDWDMDLQTNVARRSLIHDQCFGYQEGVQDWGYDTFLSHVIPDDRAKVDDTYKKAMADGAIYDVEFRVCWPDNTIHWLWSKGRFYNDKQGRPIRVSGIQVDITQRKHEELALKLNSSAIEASSSGIIIVNALQQDYPIEYVNQGYEKITGYSKNEVIGMNYSFMSSSLRDEEKLSQIRAALEIGESIEIELPNQKKDGTPFWSHLKISPIKNDLGKVTHFVGIQTDISERKNAEAEHIALSEKINYLAYYDVLTGLPNKESLNKYLEAFLNSSSTIKMCHAIFLMDIDNFKNINDSFGHYLGDLFIKEVSTRIANLLGKECFICRFGGDEFILVISDQMQHSDQLFDRAKSVAEMLLSSMRVPFKLNGLEFFSSISIGLKLIKEDLNIINAIKQADLAMYEAKSLGKNNIQIFDDNLEKVVLYKSRLEACLRNAIDINEFELYYQPQVNSKNKIFGCEALIRWQSAELGNYVSPTEFIPIAEQTSLILPIGQWVLESACKTLSRWHEIDAFKDITLAVNISAIQFKNTNFVSVLEKVLLNYNFNRSNLKLELTETMLAEDIDKIIIVMNQIKKMGLTISLDDFGTGYSSLSYLKSFPINQLKIDHSFVHYILIDINDALIAEAVIKLSQSLGLETIAEGVETEEQMECLIKLGCNQFQGFLFSKALNLSNIEKFIKEFNYQEV